MEHGMRGEHMHGSGHSHMHGYGKKAWMEKMFMKEMMEHLSPEDKKKVAAAKLDMKISRLEKQMEIMKEKKKIIDMKMEMKAQMKGQKIELLKMMRDMIKYKM
jgi:hypothetical protein